MAKAGALDSLGDRSQIVYGVDRIIALAQQEQRLRETGQTSMFDLFGTQVDTPLPALELQAITTPGPEMLSWERELLGTYISEHPFRRAAERLGEYVTAQLAEVDAELAGQEVVLAGTVKATRRLTTKQGKSFAAVTVEDLSGTGEVTVWPEQFEECRDLLTEGNVILAKVTVRERGDRLTVAAQSLAGYDLESEQLLAADLSQFRVVGGRPSRARPSSPPPASPPDGPPGGEDYEDIPPPIERPALRTVESSVTSPDASVSMTSGQRPNSANADELAGPPRLRVQMEETTDEAADRRRLKKVIDLITSVPGEHPAELAIVTRGGVTQLLMLPGVADIEPLIPQVQALLGVLGQARRIGSEVYEPVYAAAAG
jgi:DNA polymerase-3 subunit alpha